MNYMWHLCTSGNLDCSVAWLHCYFCKFILDVYLAENCVWSKTNILDCISEISRLSGFYCFRVHGIVIQLNNVFIFKVIFRKGTK